MRSVFLVLLFIGTAGFAQAQTSGNIVAQSTTETTGGLGGYTDIGYPFKRGDKVTIQATASKQLGLVRIANSRNQVLGRLKDLKKVEYTFVMPADDSVIFHFVSDRGGTNKINYTIFKEPGALQPE